MDLAKAWKARRKLKLRPYSRDRNAIQFCKQKSEEEKNDRNELLKNSIRDLIPEETLQKLMEIANQ